MRKRVTATALTLVMGCSAIFDSGLVVANAAVVLSQMDGDKIQINGTYPFGGKQDGDSFVSLDKSDTAQEGTPWMHAENRATLYKQLGSFFSYAASQ